MTQKNDGGPAFPQNDLSNYNMGPEGIGNGMGMSLRDYAVIHYTAAMLSHAIRDSAPTEDCHPDWYKAIAKEAGQLADAMIAAREAKP